VTPDEYEALVAQGMDPEDINRPGGVNLGGLPNVGDGSPAFRNQRQRQAVSSLHARESDAQEGRRRAIRSPFHMQAYSGDNPVQQDFIEQMGPVAQGHHLQGMISDVMRAYQDENDSRVAQAREQARMAHEMDMAAMENDALIQRLQMEADQRNKDRILQKQLTSGVTTRRFNPSTLQWEDV